ncbi:hypothetical protein [Treponema phagedenis]|uniref:Uncharacterized protein n=1 Tax=Treponema phagedenis TaxID=162 RepID=A0AAE6IRB2_TREPH|nr:hypothetical protein [Treponema phagedenis]QEJ96772.1 hypothetical protein FUT82_01330 [Treponema phagedenis]
MDLTKKINDLIKAKDASGLMALIKEHGGYILKRSTLVLRVITDLWESIFTAILLKKPWEK